jgi:hypothetical protein
MIKHLKIPLGKYTPSGVPEPQALAKTMTSGGSRVPWTKHPLDDASLGQSIPWTMRPLDMASLINLSSPRTALGYSLPYPAKGQSFLMFRVLLLRETWYQGRITLGTPRPRDRSYKGRLVQGTPLPTHGTHHPRSFIRGHTGRGQNNIPPFSSTAGSFQIWKGDLSLGFFFLISP